MVRPSGATEDKCIYELGSYNVSGPWVCIGLPLQYTLEQRLEATGVALVAGEFEMEADFVADGGN
jgi:hypothetical protein